MLTTAQIPAIARLEAASAALLGEVRSLSPEFFVAMPEGSTYRGDARTLLFAAGPWIREFPGISLPDNRQRCPTADALLVLHPEITVLGVLRLGPGAEVLPHADERADNEIRVHIPLVVPPEDADAWPIGTAKLLDVRHENRGGNPRASERLTLVADIRLSFAVATGDVAPWEKTPEASPPPEAPAT